MAQRIDGWMLMARIAAHPHRFAACDATAALASVLLLRSQLVQGVASEKALFDLAEVVGQAPMIDVIENLAGYEALRVVDNIDGPPAPAEERTAQTARRRLIAIVESAPAAPRLSEPLAAGPGALPGHALRRHRAMGARRIRPAG